ncbi:hypothetical protein AGDE_13978 [Angomonas deanei]|nr:hypothetical protein AGDE_13978 [Angomonas deanei]|eukprot:EPY21557.1 hypothetical protein AGDE_13978 [Angomonas deanei]
MQEDEEVGSATDRSSSHCSPSRVSRQEGRPSAGERPTIKTNPPPGVTSPTPAEEEKRPLPSIITQLNDPRMFCQLATAFFFCSDSWSSSSRMNLFQSLSEGIGAHMVREIVPGKRSKANTAQVSRAATPASGVMAPSSPASGKAAAAPIAPAQKTQLSPTTTITNVTSQPLNTWRSATTPNNTTNNGSRSHTPINNVVGTPVLGATPSNTEGDFKVLQHSHSNVSSTFTVPRQDSANPLNSAMVAAMYREAFNRSTGLRRRTTTTM